MKKLFVLFLIPALYNNHLTCMDQPVHVSLPIFLIEDEIRNKHLLQQFEWGKNTLLHKTIAHRITTFRNVNRSWRAFFDYPTTFRTIIHNYFLYMPYCKDMMDAVRSLKVQSAEPYFHISRELNTKINTLDKTHIKTYIDLGADLNYCDNSCVPVLFKADVSRKKIVLKLGADPNIELSKDETPLAWAVENKKKLARKEQIKNIKLLLAHNPRKKCLPTAICLQDNEIIELILKQKNISDKELLEAINCASFSFLPGLKFLTKYTKKYPPGQESEQTLMQLFDMEQYERMKFLLSHGADLNVTRKTKTPLMRAIKKNNILLAQLFLAYKPQNLCLPYLIDADNPIMAQLFLENNISLEDLDACIRASFKEKKMNIAAVFVQAYLGSELMTALLKLFSYNDRHPNQQKQIMPILDHLWVLNDQYLTNFKKNAFKNLKRTRQFITKHDITHEEVFKFICRSLKGTAFQGRDQKMMVSPYITIYLGSELTRALLNMFAYNDGHPQQRKQFLPIIRLLCNLPDENLTEFRQYTMKII